MAKPGKEGRNGCSYQFWWTDYTIS